jgi:Flp pilus assembly protein TadG
MAVVDVGFFLHNRENAQQTADAAALAGAHYLPGSTSDAQTEALAYVTKNGLSTANTTISFKCTGQQVSVCVTGSGTYDTIVVTQKASSPTYFGGILSILGFNNCWVAGCTASASAGACHSGCGGPISEPLDVVVVMDRTGSMTASDLTNAKNGALAILTVFNPALQHVALGVLGPSSTSSTCGSPNAGGLGIATSSGGTWMPVPLSSDYQNANGTLNTSSLIVKTINCLNTSSVGTDLGDPLKAAMDYLVASGRPDVKKGIILLTDGAANRPLGVPGLTGEQFCINQAFVPNPNNGDGNGYEGDLTHPSSNACANDGNSTMDSNSGTSGSSTSCSPPSTTKDKHRFSNFNISIPSSPTPTIDGIDVRLDAWATSGASTRRLCARLSWNAGTNWTGYQQVDLSGTTEATYHLGGFDVNWGRTWSLSDLSNPNFLVEVTDVASNTSTTFNLDAVAVNIAYHTPNSSLSGPCDYAATQADAARAAGIELFTIGYGVSGDRCVDDGSGSRFENAPTTRLLAWMATGATPTADDGGDGPGGLQGGCAGPTEITSENADGDNFLCEARGSDLVPLFRAAAEALASGSRLVKIPF